MLFSIKQARLSSNISQSALAQLSGVSLPTIQNIEANKANPTIDVLSKILSVLGIEITLETAAFDINKAASLGVPLSAQVSSVPPSRELLIKESKKWTRLIEEHKLSTRELEAIVATLIALKNHFPSFYAKWIKTNVIENAIKEMLYEGKIIKLRRIALNKISAYI